MTEKVKTCSKKKPTPKKRRRRTQREWGVDIQKWLAETGIEFHWPGYQYMGPGTNLAKHLKRGDPGINRLDKIAKQHDIDYSFAQNLQDKWKFHTKMIKAIDRLPGKKTRMERVVKRIRQAKKRLKLYKQTCFFFIVNKCTIICTQVAMTTTTVVVFSNGKK